MIYKYEIPIVSLFNLKLPIDSEIPSVQINNDKPVMWIMMDLDNFKIEYNFKLYQTGNCLYSHNKTDLNYIDTFQINRLGKLFVYHLFADGIKKA